MQDTCYYCNTVLVNWTHCKGKNNIPQNGRTRDHLVPRYIRGRGSRVPQVACCVACNQDKGRLTVEEFRVVVAFRHGMIAAVDFRFPGEKVG